MQIEEGQVRPPTSYHFKQVFHSVERTFRVHHDFLLKWHYTCGLQKFSRPWCPLLKGMSKTLLIFLTEKHISGQWHKTKTAPIPPPGIPAFCFNDPCYSGNGCRIIRTEPQVSGWQSNSSRMRGIKRSTLDPQGKGQHRASHSLDKWFCKADLFSGLYFRHCCFNRCGSKIENYVTQCLEQLEKKSKQ